MRKPLLVIAVGGNSLITDSQHMTVLDQYRAAGQTSRHIASLIDDGSNVVVTHGNGPQVGFILMRSELAKDMLHQVPLESCVADTQGAIGYQIQQTLGNELLKRGMNRRLATVVTQVVVDGNDPAFKKPSKPIGPFYSEEDACHHEKTDGWTVMDFGRRGWRRVVPSPEPLEIVEQEAIRILLENGVIVTAAGGGGIPVVRNEIGELEGRAAVVDKDASSCLLAVNLGADTFVISTAVDKVMLDFEGPAQKAIDHMTVEEAVGYMSDGHFASGSMKPKIKAAVEFLKRGGKRVVITQPHLLEEAMAGDNGTHITP